jgi:enoyl-CoA hydratase/carnithine racemase
MSVSAIAARPRQAVMETRRLLRQPAHTPMLRRMDEEATIFAELVRSDHCTRLFRQFLAN